MPTLSSRKLSIRVSNTFCTQGGLVIDKTAYQYFFKLRINAEGWQNNLNAITG